MFRGSMADTIWNMKPRSRSVRVVAPMMAIETVAAGGGSICRFDGVKLVVGPDSAGADPGPACYGRGGPLAVTDLNVHSGKILPDGFPFPLDLTAVEHRLTELAAMVADATGRRLFARRTCRSRPAPRGQCPAWFARSEMSRLRRGAIRDSIFWCPSAARPGSTRAPWLGS